MGIEIKDSAEPCNATWHFAQSFTAGEITEILFIETNVKCSLKGYERFQVTFRNPQLVQDLHNNSLQNPVITANTLSYVYVNPTQRAVLEGAGDTFTVMTFLTFAFVIGMNLLQSAAVGSFWAFINMLQLLSYIPVINCTLPYTLEVFLTQYLSVSKVSFPFQLFISGFSLLSWPTFLTLPLNPRFSLSGYDSTSFIYNFAEQLSTWLLLALLYVLLCVLTKVFPEPKYCLCRFWMSREIKK